MRRSLAIAAAACLWMTAGSLALAQQPPDEPEPPKEGKETPKSEQSVTQHSLVIDGKTIAYTATAGTLIPRQERQGRAGREHFGYTAYTRRRTTMIYSGPADHVLFQRRPGLSASGCTSACSVRAGGRRTSRRPPAAATS